MWDLGNRGAVVLISVTCGCVLVYNAWGAILGLALSLLLVIYACYSLLTNDSLVSPHAYYVLGYLRDAVLELRTALDIAVAYGIEYVHKLWRSAIHFYRERFPFRMNRPRGTNYQLSSDVYAAGGQNSRDLSSSSRFGVINQLSPIPRVNDALISEDSYYHAGDHDRSRLAFGKRTSTPVFGPAREEFRNGDVGLSHPLHMSFKRSIPMYAQNHTLSRGENITQFSPEGSPWGTSISPKMRSRAAGVKTVQTVAGPLLASTRFNIDPKVYTDVSSPGLTTRLTKYATEANNKLTHQSQYSMGQFPKVNIHAGPIPLLNTKSAKMRMPVTVRVAPPDIARYSPPERQKLLSNICRMENKSPTSVVQVLRDISLKRHASRDDVIFEVAKKQRTESLFIEEREVPEEIKQKRSRDDSSKSEDELFPHNKSIRPAKRTKTPSCYDILNSLSSSIHVTSGVKRKAVDLSRSGTPDFEKHFKSLETAQNNNSHTLPQSRSLDAIRIKTDVKEIYSTSHEFALIKGILKVSNKETKVNVIKPMSEDQKNARISEAGDSERIAPMNVRLTDKLFMRAEPKRNERLKLLVEEQGNIKAKFATDNVEEIKREDIRNMRQTSMKARLQSMFDAISGKGESKINPDVVIQADDVNVVTPVTCSANCATLNSSTTTTNVNTTPISTSAVVPGGLSTLNPDAKPTALIAFNLSNTGSSSQSNAQATVKIKATDSATKVDPIDKKKGISTTPAVVSTASLINTVPSINAVSTFTIGKQPSESPTVTSSLSVNFGTSTSGNNAVKSISTSVLPTSSTSTNLFGGDKTPLSSAFVPINSASTSSTKAESNVATTTNVNINLSNATSIQTNSIFTFGDRAFSSSAMPTVAQTLTSTLPSQSAGTMFLPHTKKITSIAACSNVTTSTSTTSIATSAPTTSTPAIPAPAQAPLFNFGSNFTSQPAKSDTLVFDQSGNNIQSANTFGNTSSSQVTSLPQDTNKSFILTSSHLTPNTNNSSFNANTSNIIPTFGLSAAPTFSLSTPVISTSKPLFLFGANTGSAIATPATTAPNPIIFGTMNNNTIPTFGASTTTTPQLGAATTSIFAATSSAPVLGTANSQPIFGSTSAPITTSIFTVPKTTAASLFAPTTTVTPSINGTTSSITIFSNTNAATNVTSSTTTAPSVFGSNATIFGQTKSSTSFGAGTGVFGSGATPLFGSPVTTTPAFGIANTPANTINLNFDSTSNVTSAFGSHNVNTTTNTQSTTTPAYGGTPSMFGPTDNTAVLIFGATATSAAATFPSSITSTFGGQNSANLTFGTVANNSAFGVNKPLFGAAPTTTTGFTIPSSSIPAFGTGTTDNTGNNANNMIFGSNQKTEQQNATFSFATSFNTDSNNSVTVSAPFQFGSTSLKPATGFNFTAPSAMPSINFGTTSGTTFNASTPGMFNIGSGSTAPRSRTIRTRKPR